MSPWSPPCFKVFSLLPCMGSIYRMWGSESYSLVLFFPFHVPQPFMEISHSFSSFFPFLPRFHPPLYLSSPSVFPQLLQSYCYILSPWMATTPSCYLYVTEANYFFISFIALLCPNATFATTVSSTWLNMSFSKIKHRTCEMAQWVRKGAHCQVRVLKFESHNPHNTRRERTPASCPLTPTCTCAIARILYPHTEQIRVSLLPMPLLLLPSSQ